MRNSLHRRTHKERSQPLERQKLGLLEKKKDYVARARNYHNKRDRIERLREKAADRNKDEFYFAMKNQKTNRGVHVKYRENPSLVTEIAAVLKAQDANYIRTMRKANVKAISSLKAKLTTLANLVNPASFRPMDEDGQEGSSDDLDEKEMDILRKAGVVPPLPTEKSEIRTGHIVFVDDEESAWKYKAPSKAPVASSSKMVEEDPVDLGWVVKGKKKAVVVDDEADWTDDEDSKNEPKKNRSKLLKELAARLERDQHLRYAEQELEVQRLTMAGKGAHKKLLEKEQVFQNPEDDDEFSFRRKNRMPVVELGNEVYKPKVFKWRQERKR